MPTPSPAPTPTPTLAAAAAATVATAVGQLSVNTHDIERSVAFYRDVIGLPFLFQYPGLAFFMCGTVRLMLSAPDKPEFDHPGCVIYFKVDDIGGAYERMKAAGAVFVDQPHVVHRAETYELWMTFLHDPDRNPLALMQEKPLAG